MGGKAEVSGRMSPANQVPCIQLILGQACRKQSSCGSPPVLTSAGSVLNSSVDFSFKQSDDPCQRFNKPVNLIIGIINGEGNTHRCGNLVMVHYRIRTKAS